MKKIIVSLIALFIIFLTAVLTINHFTLTEEEKLFKENMKVLAQGCYVVCPLGCYPTPTGCRYLEDDTECIPESIVCICPDGGCATSGIIGGVEPKYKRHDNETCDIYVGVKGKLKVFGIGILYADGDGWIKFSGKVVCEADGNLTCRPVECVDLYEVIF